MQSQNEQSQAVEQTQEGAIKAQHHVQEPKASQQSHRQQVIQSLRSSIFRNNNLRILAADFDPPTGVWIINTLFDDYDPKQPGELARELDLIPMEETIEVCIRLFKLIGVRCELFQGQAVADALENAKHFLQFVEQNKHVLDWMDNKTLSQVGKLHHCKYSLECMVYVRKCMLAALEHACTGIVSALEDDGYLEQKSAGRHLLKLVKQIFVGIASLSAQHEMIGHQTKYVHQLVMDLVQKGERKFMVEQDAAQIRDGALWTVYSAMVEPGSVRNSFKFCGSLRWLLTPEFGVNLNDEFVTEFGRLVDLVDKQDQSGVAQESDSQPQEFDDHPFFTGTYKPFTGFDKVIAMTSMVIDRVQKTVKSFKLKENDAWLAQLRGVSCLDREGNHDENFALVQSVSTQADNLCFDLFNETYDRRENLSQSISDNQKLIIDQVHSMLITLVNKRGEDLAGVNQHLKLAFGILKGQIGHFVHGVHEIEKVDQSLKTRSQMAMKVWNENLAKALSIRRKSYEEDFRATQKQQLQYVQESGHTDEWEHENHTTSSMSVINPTTGLPMIGGDGLVDIGGNIWGNVDIVDYS